MAKAGPTDLTLQQHRARGGPVADRVLAEVAAGPAYLLRVNPVVVEARTLPADELRSVVMVLFERAAAGGGLGTRLRAAFLSGMPPAYEPVRAIGELSGRRLPWSRADAAVLLALLADVLRRQPAHDPWLLISLVGQPVSAAEQAVRAGGLDDLEGPIREVADLLGRFDQYARGRAAQYRGRLVALLEAGGAGLDPNLFDPGDTWGLAWSARAAELEPALQRLVVSLALVSSVTPTAAWRRRASDLVTAAGAGALLREMLESAAGAQGRAAARTLQVGDQEFAIAPPDLADQNAIIVRGAIWAAATLDEPWAPEALAMVGLHFGTSGSGSNIARDERLANACAAALGTLSSPAAFAALGRLKARVTNRNVAKQVWKALEAAATRAGLSASELLELAVPTQGLDAAGRREIPIGDHAAILAIEGDAAVLTWRAPDERVTARPPTALAGSAKGEIARAKDELRELRRALAVERDRIEDLFVEERDWALSDWRTRYLGHPLTGTLARRLIWTFGGAGDGGAAIVTALPDGDRLTTADGTVFEPPVDARVRVWHPIDASEAEIAAWRTQLLERRLRQPFKQAFREVYRLTPAEEETDVYSNRFAAHILRYPQARALMTARHWASNFLGPFDGGDTGVARRDFPGHGLRAEFWHDQLEGTFGGDVEFCSTDQVRFMRSGLHDEAVPLRDVPRLVLSEAMRDVDLFVSVSSVGADRNWQDGGQNRITRMEAYWRGYWDRELTASATVRRDVIERMLPGLAIADRLELQDRWLQVRGDLRTYRIHLGSGNILMAPSDTYLCIVPTRGGSAERVFLPFDDDPTLSIILSKAFLLAADSRIADPAIVRQIRSY